MFPVRTHLWLRLRRAVLSFFILPGTSFGRYPPSVWQLASLPP